MAERQQICRGFGHEPARGGCGPVHRGTVRDLHACLDEERRHIVAMCEREVLPHLLAASVAMHVTPAADVHQHVEDQPIAALKLG